jgi:hypothetical protein
MIGNPIEVWLLVRLIRGCRWIVDDLRRGRIDTCRVHAGSPGSALLAHPASVRASSREYIDTVMKCLDISRGRFV